MTNLTSRKPPFWFWIISVIALFWNGMGVNHYLQQAYKTDSFKAMYPDEKVLEMVLNTPSWVMAAFAIAVFFGVLGAIALLLRKSWAQPLFLISLIGILIQMTYNLFISEAIEIYGPVAIAMPIMILAFGVFILWFSRKAIAKLWIH